MNWSVSQNGIFDCHFVRKFEILVSMACKTLAWPKRIESDPAFLNSRYFLLFELMSYIINSQKLRIKTFYH